MREPNLSLWFECGDESLSIRRYAVNEAMNEPFEIDLVVVSSNDDLDLEAFVGRAARFGVGAKRSRTLEGLVQSMTLVAAEATGVSTYRVRIVPRLWLLTQRTDNRVFQHLSIPDIVREVIKGARVEAGFRIDEGAYPKHEYRVQYEETDYAFMSRLCEEAGIAFFFDESSKLTFADAPGNADPRDGKIPYHAAKGVASFDESFEAIELRDEIRPARYTLRDHDFRRHPEFELFGRGSHPHDVEEELERYHYQPGATWVVTDDASDTPAADDRAIARASTVEGESRAKRTLESLRAGKLEVTLRGNTVDLAPGVVFNVSRHPHRELRDDRPLLVVASCLRGDTNDNWSATFTAHFAEQPFRPRIRTPRPRIRGIQSAIVVGPEGEEIHTDEFGRVRIQFHWDRIGEMNHESSCWVRVSQGWAGGGQGMIVLPRIGQEVFVAYLEGDPDRPIVVGRCFNNTARVPHALPMHKTRSAWRSETSPRNGGYNEVMMEDANGEELFQMHAQKDMQKRVNNNSATSIGNSLTESVANNKSLFVGSDQVASVVGNCLKTVGMIYQVAVPPPSMIPGAKSVGAAAASGDTPAMGSIRIGDPVPAAPPPAAQPATPAATPPPTQQTWTFNSAELTANNSTIKLQKDITITTEGNLRIEAKGTVTIVGKVIDLNP